MKSCFKCGETKPLTEFYRHEAMRDGHLNKCKACTKADVAANTEKRIDYYREYDRRRYQENETRKAQYTSLPKRRSPSQIKANWTLSNAIRDGRVTRAEACWHCGSTRNVEGHHVAYDMPLDVVWLCRSCHCKAHRQTTIHEQQRQAA